MALKIFTRLIRHCIFGDAAYNASGRAKGRKIEPFNRRLKLYTPWISEAFYLIEYKKDWYNDSFHEGSENEKRIDALLSQLDYLCYAREIGLIGEEVFGYFDYHLDRISRDTQVRAYMRFLFHWAKSFNQRCAFDHFIKNMISRMTEEEREMFERTDITL